MLKKLTHDVTLVAFWRWRKLLQCLSAKENERNLYQNLLTIENNASDLKVHALQYANELLKNFGNSPNNNKNNIASRYYSFKARN